MFSRRRAPPRQLTTKDGQPMSFTAGTKKNHSIGMTFRWLAVLGLWLALGSAPVGERPRLSLEGRLAGLSLDEQLALGKLSPRQLRKKRPGLTGRGEESPKPVEGIGESLYGSGRIALMLGRFDDAIADLEAAAAVTPGAADLESDLAVARLSRGLAHSNPQDFFLALKAADRALHIDPGSLPAHFNRALALTQMQLLDAAEETWASYLEAEEDPGWREEARARAPVRLRWESDKNLERAFEAAAARLDRPAMTATVLRSPRFFREHAEEVLLVAWGAAIARGDEHEASRSLQMVRWIGEALTSLHEDSTLARTVAHIERSRTQAPENVAFIAGGLEAYGQGLTLTASEHYAAALALFDRADKVLSEAGSPFASWARFQVALCHYQASHYGPAKRLLRSLAPVALAEKQLAVHGRVMALLALIELIEGNPAVALGDFKTAVQSFQALWEPSHQAKQQALIAACFDYLGQRQEAWRWLHSALVAEGFRGSVDEGTVTHLIGAWLALEEGEPQIALLFQEKVLQAGHKIGRSTAIVEALRGRAGILEGMGRKEDAQQDLRKAREVLQQVGDKPLARGIEGDLAFLEGTIALQHSPTRALQLFDQAIEIFRSTSYWYRLVLALLERARLLIALGRPTLAERDLADAIAESERQRLSIDVPSHRVSYFDQIRTLLDMMVDLQMHQLDRPRLALEYSERARARVLWDWLKVQPLPQELDPGVEASLAPAAIESWNCELPASSLVVEYAVLPERLVLWSMEDCSQSVAATVEIGAESLTLLVEDFREAILGKRHERSEELAKKLYELLIRPFESRLQPDQPLVLIPDGPLHDLPFSLLQDEKTRRRLFQDHAVSLAPSLRILSSGLQRDRNLAKNTPPRALVVTAPAATQGIHRLRQLTAGDVEATIADILPGSWVLADVEATKTKFFAMSRELEILHFGGHSVVNPDSPLLSYMLFAPEPDDPSGMLYSRDLLNLRFPSVRLAVLASCESGLGKHSRSEGVESLARPFLAAGVPGVIASLWKVGDQSTADFFVRFYRHLAATWNVAEALRATQIELLEQDPEISGAFVYIGTAFTE